MKRFFLRHAPDPRPSLVVQTCERADGEAVRAFCDLLFGLGCSEGLLFDQNECLLVHDSFAAVAPSSLSVEARMATAIVLEKLGRFGYSTRRSLDERVELWLGMLARSGAEALPNDPKAAEPFLVGVLPSAAEAVISSESMPAQDVA
jgi:hypothetical protein